MWLSKDEASYEKLPKELLDFEKCGITIQWCERSYKPYNKLIHSLKMHPNDIIVTFDDDHFYPNFILERLYIAYLKNPHVIHCHDLTRAKFDENNNLLPYSRWYKKAESRFTKACFSNLAVGVRGVLYPPHSLHKSVLDMDLAMKLSPTADDIWFFAMAVLNDTKIALVENYYQTLDIPSWKSQDTALWRINCTENQNDVQLNNVLSHFKEVYQKLLDENVRF